MLQLFTSGIIVLLLDEIYKEVMVWEVEFHYLLQLIFVKIYYGKHLVHQLL